MKEELKKAVKEIAWLQAKYYDSFEEKKPDKFIDMTDENLSCTLLGKTDGLRRALVVLRYGMKDVFEQDYDVFDEWVKEGVDEYKNSK